MNNSRVLALTCFQKLGWLIFLLTNLHLVLAQSIEDRTALLEEAITLFAENNYEASKLILLQVDSLTQNDQVDSIAAKAYYWLGRIGYVQRKGKDGVNWLEKAVRWYDQHDDVNPLLHFKSCEWLGNVFRYRLRDAYHALPYYQQGLSLIEKHALLDPDAERRMTYNLASVYRLIQDTERSLIYAHMSIRLAEKASVAQATLASHLNQIGTIYMSAVNPEQALAFFERALSKLPESSNFNVRRFRYRSNVSDALRELGKWQQAQEIQLTNLYEMLEMPDIDPYQLGTTYYVLAKNARLLEDWISFETYCQKTMEHYETVFGVEHPAVARIYSYQAGVFLDQPHVALPLLDTALMVLWPSSALGAHGLESFPDQTDWEWLFITLAYKATALSHQVRQFGGSLNESLRYYQKALQVYEYYRSTFIHGKSVFGLSQANFELFDDIFESVNYALSTSNSSSSVFAWHELAWKTMEMAKGYLLFRKFSERNAFKHVSLQDSIYESYRDLVGQSYLFNQKTDERYEILKQVDTWKKEIRRQYPSYVNFLDQSESASLNATKMLLDNKQVLVNYYEGNTDVFALSVAENQIHFWSVPKDSIWEASLSNYQRFVATQNPGQLTMREVSEATRSGFVLYQKLVLPLGLEDSDELIVVAHSRLEQLPFEALLTEELATPTFNFQTYPYLIRNTPVQYAFSGTHWLNCSQQLRIENKEKGVKVATFAWGNNARLDYSPLPYSTEEAAVVSALWKGQSYVADQASEAQFRAVLFSNDVIHVALHGDASEADQSPELVFPVADSLNDGVFNLNELYGLEMKNNLIVLSSCYTGEGQFMLGEGTLSLARGFAYAGSQAILSNLWPSYDRSSFNLLKGWYELIAQHESLSVALMKSKEAYLQSAMPIEGHPSRWAGVILIGDYVFYKYENDATFYWIVCLSMLLLITGVLFKRIT